MTKVLARAKATSVDGLAEAGVLDGGAGKVRLRKWVEYPAHWNPGTDARLPVWEALHQLAYRLYTLCERLGQAEDARAYNELITSWTGIESAAASAKTELPDPFNRE